MASVGRKLALFLGAVVSARARKRHNNNQEIDVIPLVDNFRYVQPLGDERVVYRSPGTSDRCHAFLECDASAACYRDVKPSDNDRRDAKTTDHHWHYSDQSGWPRYESHETECLFRGAAPSYPGESPINIQPFNTTVAEEIMLSLDISFHSPRPKLTVTNDGYIASVTVCGSNAYDCKALANFGSWPRTLRGLDDENNSTYYLQQIDFHWGSDSSKGSEHTICGSAWPAEMQMRFAQVEPTTEDREDAASGTAVVILSTLIRADANETNMALAPILDAVYPPFSNGASHADQSHVDHDAGQPSDDEHDHGETESHHGGLATAANTSAPTASPMTLLDLLPGSFSSRYYTYAGSMTQPPCTQDVTWFVFEQTVSVSESQLEQLRRATTNHHLHHIHVHSFHALLFPFVAIAMGTLTQHLLSRHAPHVPYTMVVMLEGFVLDWLASANNEGRLNAMQQSLRLWSKIDPHLLLYSFLPALLFGDVTNLNVHTFAKTFWQALLLAGPGVLIGTVLTALAVKTFFPYDWSFSLCMTLGSILSATDPVAVVSLLKAVGASTRLTMQITGESLLNDGSAMVVFTIFFDVSRGRPYSTSQVVEYFARMVFVSPLLGGFIGLVALVWMSRASQRHAECDGIIQLAITICAAYLAFYLGESTAKTSGILTTVAAGLILAWRVWPFVVSAEAMENVWHAIEYLGNTLLFSLAGLLARRATFTASIGGREFVWCFVLYIVVMIIRGVMLALLYPLLKHASEYGTKPADVVFMWWGGLRGAVGLALALYVNATLNSNDNDNDDKDGDRVLFFVAGVALLTLVINAPTSGTVLRSLNLIGIGKLEREFVSTVRQKIVEAAEIEYAEVCLKLDHDGTDIIQHVSSLKQIENTIKAEPASAVRRNDGIRAILLIWNDTTVIRRLRSGFDAFKYCASHPIINTTTQPAVRRRISRIQATRGRGSASESVAFGIGYLNDLDEVKQRSADEARVAIFREAFYRIIKSEYWAMIDDGQLPRKAAATIHLLQSVDIALDDVERPLHDFHYLLSIVDQPIGGEQQDQCLDCIDTCLPVSCTVDKELHYALNYQKHEIVYYVLRAFSLAHHRAQHKLVALFGEDSERPDTPEQMVVVSESQSQILSAKQRLDSISPNVKKIVKSSIVARNVLEIQHSTIRRFVEQGILTTIEAKEIVEELIDDQHKYRAAHRRETFAAAKRAAVEEVSIRKLHTHGKTLGGKDERRNMHEMLLESAISAKKLPGINNSEPAYEPEIKDVEAASGHCQGDAKEDDL